MKRVGGSSEGLDDSYKKLRRSTDTSLQKFVPTDDVSMEACCSVPATSAGDKPSASKSTEYLNGLINGFSEMNVSFRAQEATVVKFEESATVATAKPVMDPRTRRRILSDADPKKAARHADLRMIARRAGSRKGVQNIGHYPSNEKQHRDQKARDMARIRNQERFDRDMARRQLNLRAVQNPDMPMDIDYAPHELHCLNTVPIPVFDTLPSSSTQMPTNSEASPIPPSTNPAPNWNPLAFRASTLAKYSQVRAIITAERRHSDVCLTETPAEVDIALDPPLPSMSPPLMATSTSSLSDVTSSKNAKRRNPLGERRILIAHRRLHTQSQAKTATKETQ
uniref:BZIP domain-containing protein n=1 Tax=Panagrellus redivivus TaxID=6233 RepID=A0A7E4VY72_PANRE